MPRYEIYVDLNAASFCDASARRYAGSDDNAEEAIAQCQRITLASVMACYSAPMSAAELNYAYLERGDDPFIVGPATVLFSAWTYARECCCAITGEGPPLDRPHHHPCDYPPAKLLNDPTSRPVIHWRTDKRCMRYLPNPYGEACRLAKANGPEANMAFLENVGRELLWGGLELDT